MVMNNEVSRRGFISGAALLGATVAATGIAGCAGNQSSSATGSTASTDSAAEATATAATAADWLGSAPEIAESDISVAGDADIVVVGGGTGGLFAAASAVEEGATVIVLEKGESYGSVKDDLGAVNTRLQQEDGTVIDRAEARLDAYRYSNGHMSIPLFNKWFDNSGETVDWYTDLLAENDVMMWHEAAVGDKEGSLPHWATGHSPAWPVDSEGKETLDGGMVLGDFITANGGEIVFSTPMVKLAMDGDKVVGVIAQNADGAYVQYNASKGVVLATGGYGGNADMVTALQPDVNAVTAMTWAPPTNAGDGIKAAMWAGAAMDPVHSSMFFDRAAIAPNEISGEAKGSMFWMGSQPWLKVNLEGKRFTNEGTGVYDWILHAALNQPDNTYCTLFDANWSTYAEAFTMHGCSRLFPFENGAPSNHDIPFAQSQIEKLVGDGKMIQADTIEDLAAGLGIPADALVGTVERYNSLYDSGVDEDFGKESFRLSKLDTPPYYGVRQSGCLLCTMDGVRINEDCQALREDGSAIEGLYVTGNDSGMFFDTSYPNQFTGFACGRTVTFGRMIGKLLAAR